jgi:hypothetical protein
MNSNRGINLEVPETLAKMKEMSRRITGVPGKGGSRSMAFLIHNLVVIWNGVNTCPGCFTPLPRESAFGFKRSCLQTIITAGHRPSLVLCSAVIRLNVPDKQHAYTTRKFQPVTALTFVHHITSSILNLLGTGTVKCRFLGVAVLTSNVRIIGKNFHRPDG